MAVPRNSKLKDLKPVKMWAAVSEDIPPKIGEIGWYADQLQSNLRKIRVMVTPIARKPRKKPAKR